MKSRIVLALVAVSLLAGGGGYWLGKRPPAPGATPAAAAGVKERRVLYYRNPMGLADTSPTPKKDSMGMDYVAVFADEADAAPAATGQVRISTEKIQKLGVRTEAAAVRRLDRVVRAAGRIEADERRTYTITPKFEGYVERLHVNVTGQPVARGQPLFEFYSPELVSAQREYTIAAQGVEALRNADSAEQAGMRQLAEASLQRLRNWDIPEEQIEALRKTGEARRTLSFRSPVAGIVTEKKAVQGMRFMAGEALFQVADLSSVWVIAEVYEQEIAAIRTGTTARLRIAAYPDKVFEGRIAYVYPSLKAETRTVPVRIELANPGLLLKPAMYAQVELPVAGHAAAVVVPLSAVIDSGTRQIVLIDAGEGRFEPRPVHLGARNDEFVEVLHGVREGEKVVVAANFLIDAESNLKAAIAGFGQPTPAAATPAPTKAVGHQGQGSVERVDTGAGSIRLSHGAIASLQWPPMTMDFKLANPALAQGLQPGSRVGFAFVERQPGEWVITALQPLPGAATAPAAHAGH